LGRAERRFLKKKKREGISSLSSKKGKKGGLVSNSRAILAYSKGEARFPRGKTRKEGGGGETLLGEE